jgi:hypothetical protein
MSDLPSISNRPLRRRQRAARLLVPLGQRPARGHLLRVFDGSQPPARTLARPDA